MVRVLVVEDDAMIAMMVEDMLVELGHEVVDLAMRLPEALRLASEADFDLAVLDVNLDGWKSFPVADMLSRRGIVFLFATGYGASGVDAAHAGSPVIAKPFMMDDLRNAISQALAARVPPAEPAFNYPISGSGASRFSRLY